jgi:hypothetical protein
MSSADLFQPLRTISHTAGRLWTQEADWYFSNGKDLEGMRAGSRFEDLIRHNDDYSLETSPTVKAAL